MEETVDLRPYLAALGRYFWLIGGAIVDNHYFVILRHFGQRLERADNHGGDGPRVVVRGEEGGDAGKFGHGG